MFKSLESWLHSGEHLPVILRDFHDQKDIFKGMHRQYEGNKSLSIPWTTGHVYTIDCFLWFMASRGYTLQKTRKKLKFREFPDMRAEEAEAIKSIFDSET